MPLKLMLNPKKLGCNAYYEPISGLHVTLTKRHGQINQMNPHIFNALKNGTLIPLNFMVNIETKEVEMIGASAASESVPQTTLGPQTVKSYPSSDTVTEPKMQVSRPGPGINKQTVIEKPADGVHPADGIHPAGGVRPDAPLGNSQAENNTGAEEKDVKKQARGRSKTSNKE
jgi:hypothetical protein